MVYSKVLSALLVSQNKPPAKLFNSLQSELKSKEYGKTRMGAPLYRADGSATATANGYTIVGAVNGPLEVQRRDEVPEEAAIEVNVRPAIGVASECKPVPSQRMMHMVIFDSTADHVHI